MLPPPHGVSIRRAATSSRATATAGESSDIVTAPP
jgi:hypothetical protein